MALSGSGGDSNGIFALAGFGSTGSAGDITISAGKTIQIDNSVIGSTALSSGNGGNVSLSAGNVALINAAQIGSSSSGSGNAGNILIETGNLSLIAGARINSNTFDVETAAQSHSWQPIL